MTATPRTAESLPGPKGLPILGNLLQVVPARLHLQMEAWAREFGSPFHLDMMGRPIIVSDDVAAFQQIMRQRPHDWQRSTPVRLAAQEMGFDGLFTAEGDEWLPQRKLIMQALNHTNLPAFFPMLQQVTERLYRRFERAAAANETFDMTDELMRYTVDVTSALAFGEDPNTIEQSGDRIQQHMALIFPALLRRIMAPIHWWRWLPSPSERRLKGALAAVHAHVDALIARGREQLRQRQPGKPRHLLEAMLMQAQSGESALDDQRIRANVLTLLLAGEDTTANSLSWCMPFLAEHPEAQDALAAEARSALGEASVCPSIAQLDQLELCEAAIHESMRLRPTIGIFMMMPTSDQVVGDVLVRKGERICLIHRPALQSAKNFDQPLQFRPQRWLRDSREGVHDKRAFLQFGTGPRICPGRHLAMVEVRMVLSMLLAHFRVELTIPGAELEEVLAFTVTPKRMPVRLHRRMH